MARRFIDLGFTKVYALKGGWQGWVESGYSVEERDRDVWKMPGPIPGDRPPLTDIPQEQ